MNWTLFDSFDALGKLMDARFLMLFVGLWGLTIGTVPATLIGIAPLLVLFGDDLREDWEAFRGRKEMSSF